MKLKNLVLDRIKINGKLLPLQFAVYEKLARNNYVFVFDEVGCGKTVEAGISALKTVMAGGNNILIVAPSNLTYNWYVEMLSKFGLDFKIIGGTADSVDLYNKYYSRIKIETKNISNLCIASYDSKANLNTNAAIDRISNADIEWDLVILDEGHETKNESANRYKTLSKMRAKKVMLLSATPIKNLKDDFNDERTLVGNLLSKKLDITLDPERAISFDLSYPISRNYKEVIMEQASFKTRNIGEIEYHIDENIVNKMPYSGLEFDKKRGSIFLFEHFLRSQYTDIYKTYRKPQYSENDFKTLISFDSKCAALLNRIDRFLANDKHRVVIFCYHREIVSYLEKILSCKYNNNSNGQKIVEAIHGNMLSQEERKRRIFLLDKPNTEMSNKRILILSHNIGSVGINLSRFSHMINYELPHTPADLEQRFGRIDRITNENDPLSMYFFKDKNNFFDAVYINRIIIKLQFEVLPLLPSKNLLNSTDAFINTYVDVVGKVLKIKEYLIDFTSLNDDDLNKTIEYLFETKIKENNADIEDIINKANRFLEVLNIHSTDSKEIIENKIKVFSTSYNNKISYSKAGKIESIGFQQVLGLVKNSKYLEFKKEMHLLEESILSTKKEIQELHKQGLEKLIERIIKELNSPEVSPNMVFPILYGCWTSLLELPEHPDFYLFMDAYNNQRSC